MIYFFEKLFPNYYSTNHYLFSIFMTIILVLYFTYITKNRNCILNEKYFWKYIIIFSTLILIFLLEEINLQKAKIEVRYFYSVLLFSLRICFSILPLIYFLNIIKFKKKIVCIHNIKTRSLIRAESEKARYKIFNILYILIFIKIIIFFLMRL